MCIYIYLYPANLFAIIFRDFAGAGVRRSEIGASGARKSGSGGRKTGFRAAEVGNRGGRKSEVGNLGAEVGKSSEVGALAPTERLVYLYPGKELAVCLCTLRGARGPGASKIRSTSRKSRIGAVFRGLGRTSGSGGRTTGI